MKKRGSSIHNASLAYIDMLFNALGIFVVLVMLLISSQHQKKSDTENNLRKNAIFYVILDWEGDSDADLDIWIKAPNGQTVSFMNRDMALMALDRDDMGQVNDTLYIEGQKKVILVNREVISILGTMTGEYVVNVHAYNKAGTENLTGTVELIQTNPYDILKREDFEIRKKGEETTAFRFVIDANGKVESTNKRQMKLINQQSTANNP